MRINRYEDVWIADVMTLQKLKKEQYLFLNNADAYSDSNFSQEDKNKLLVQNVENILEADTMEYISMIKSKSRNDKLPEKAG